MKKAKNNVDVEKVNTLAKSKSAWNWLNVKDFVKINGGVWTHTLNSVELFSHFCSNTLSIMSLLVIATNEI